MDELLSLLNFKVDPARIEKVNEIISQRDELREALERVTNEKNPIAILTAARDLYAKLTEDSDFVALFGEEEVDAPVED